MNQSGRSDVSQAGRSDANRWSRGPTYTAVGAIALLVAALAGGATFAKSARYTASATVFLAQAFPAQTGSNSSSIAADLQVTSHLDQVEQQVAQITGLSRSALRAGLKVNEIGTSAAMHFGFTGTSGPQAGSVAATEARAALVALAQNQSEGPADQQAAAQQAVTTLSDALGSVAAGLQVNSVVDGYSTLATALSTERAQAVAATARSTTALNAQIANDQARLVRLAAVLPQAEQDSTLLAAAQQTLQGATTAVTAAQGAIREASSGAAVTPPTITRQSRTGAILRAAVGAFVVTTAILIGILELRRRRMSPDRQHARSVRDRQRSGPTPRHSRATSA